METKRQLRKHRKLRIRAKISGTEKRPRVAVFRSNRMLYAQIIDDTKSVTVLSRQTERTNKDAARILGKEIAQAAKKKGIETVVFDRGGYRYHGSVQALAEGLREGGLKV